MYKSISATTIALLIAFPTYTNSMTGEKLTKSRQIHVVSSERPSETSTINLIRFYITNYSSEPWGLTDCRVDAFDIREDDVKIYELLKDAHFSGSQIKIEVDDTLEKTHGVCKATAVYAY